MTPSSGRQPRRKRDRHGWNSIQGYFNAHERCLDELKNYFIEAETLSITTIGTGSIQIEGRIVCKHGLFLDVLKTLELNDRRQVRTVAYRYHAGVIGPSDRPIFRYDNAHAYPGHDDAHHKHVFDHRTWREISPPQWVGYDRWPHLDQVLEELLDWWGTIGSSLNLDDVEE